MYISKITIRNFRIFDEIGITAFFKKGVNAIISENNCGKTAIIDAMRIAFSTAPYKKDTNTDEAKEEIINVLRMANSEILKKDSLIRVGHIVNDNLSTIEQDVLKQSIELGLVEPRFEAIAGALRAWIKPRWVYLRKDHSEFQLLKDSYSEEEWTKNTSEDETGVYLDILALRQLKKDLPAAVVMLLDTLSLNSFELFQNGLGYNNRLIEYFEKRAETNYTLSSVHGVKGETFDATLLIVDSTRGANTLTPAVLNSGNLNTELIRIAYVAMTRPRKLLVVSVPKTKTTLSRFSTALWDYQEL